MKVFLVERETIDWLQDYAIVVVAEDEMRAREKAKESSADFENSKLVTVTEIDLDVEQCVLIANTGA